MVAMLLEIFLTLRSSVDRSRVSQLESYLYHDITEMQAMYGCVNCDGCLLARQALGQAGLHCTSTNCVILSSFIT